MNNWTSHNDYFRKPVFGEEIRCEYYYFFVLEMGREVGEGILTLQRPTFNSLKQPFIFGWNCYRKQSSITQNKVLYQSS